MGVESAYQEEEGEGADAGPRPSSQEPATVEDIVAVAAPDEVGNGVMAMV